MYLSTINKNKLKKAIALKLNIANWREVNVDNYTITFQTNELTTYKPCDGFKDNNMLVNNFGISCDMNVFIQKYIWTINTIN
jgi:hypothetical protein